MWVLRLGLVAFVLFGCSANSSQQINPDDPFDDPFFGDGIGGSSLDEVVRGRAPSVGYLSDDGSQTAEDALLAEHADPVWGESKRDGVSDPLAPEKSFADKAGEATLSTLSVLMGAGMAALPYLIGAL
jgi:hypothetical protein